MNTVTLYHDAMDYLVGCLLERYSIEQSLAIQLEMDGDPDDYLFTRLTESLAKLSPESSDSSEIGEAESA